MRDRKLIKKPAAADDLQQFTRQAARLKYVRFSLNGFYLALAVGLHFIIHAPLLFSVLAIVALTITNYVLALLWLKVIRKVRKLTTENSSILIDPKETIAHETSFQQP